MTYEETIKKRIMDDLKNLPKFKIYCLLCGKLCTTTSHERELMHFDCYVEWKKTRQNPSENR